MDRKRKTADGFEVRTDLALEERESFKGDGGEVSGVALREWARDRSQAKFTEVKIVNEQGARAMGKPVGTYLTLEADQLSQKDPSSVEVLGIFRSFKSSPLLHSL